MDIDVAVRAWVDGWMEAWKAKDPAAVAALYTSDVFYLSHPFREPHLGRGSVFRYAKDSFESEEPRDVLFGEPVAAGHRASVEYWAVLRTGEGEVTLAGNVMLRFADDGLCSEQRDYWSMEPGRRMPTGNWGDLAASGSR